MVFPGLFQPLAVGFRLFLYMGGVLVRAHYAQSIKLTITKQKIEKPLSIPNAKQPSLPPLRDTTATILKAHHDPE